MNWTTLAGRTPPWLMPVASGVLAVSLAVTGFWGYSTNRDLEQAQTDLAAGRETIDDQVAQLGGLREDLERAEAAADRLTANVTDLEARVGNQDACIAALEVDGGILGDVADKQIEINNLTADGSVWVEAEVEYEELTTTALDAYFEAYSAAWDGRYDAANEWIDRGNVAVESSDLLVDTMNAEIDKANGLIDEVNAMLDDYAANDISMCLPSQSASS